MAETNEFAVSSTLQSDTRHFAGQLRGVLYPTMAQVVAKKWIERYAHDEIAGDSDKADRDFLARPRLK